MIRELKLDDGVLYTEPRNLGPVTKAGLVFGLGGDVVLKKSWDLKRLVKSTVNNQSRFNYRRIVETNGEEPGLWLFAHTLVAAGARYSFWDEINQRELHAEIVCPSSSTDPAIPIETKVTLSAAAWFDRLDLLDKGLSACERVSPSSVVPRPQESPVITLDMDLDRSWWQESDEVTDAFWADIHEFTNRSVRERL